MIHIDQFVRLLPGVHNHVPKYIRPNYFLLHMGLKSLSGREFRSTRIPLSYSRRYTKD